MRPGRARRLRSDRGNAIVEFAFWLPYILLAVVAVVHATVALYDYRAAEDAARIGLRAQVSGADPEQAARAALEGRAGRATVTVDDGSVRVTMSVPQFLPWLPPTLATVSATAGDEP
jgi:Flp pilus assembly protein TadG